MVSLPAFATTVVGSFPHLEAVDLARRLVKHLDVPSWPQLPRRSFRENMYVMYGPRLPGIVVDEALERIFFDTTTDLSGGLESFYEHYLADDLEAFGLQEEYARGYFDFLQALKETPGNWVKGQVTGPVSFGLTVTDQDQRASLYDEVLADVIVKNLAYNARWQVRQLKALRPEVILFVDEPYMASFGSAYVSLAREQVIAMLDEVFSGIHAEGGVSGVHCCGNTDWSVLLATQVNILNLDAFGNIHNLALYPAELRGFLDRGGWICWGIVPNQAEIWNVTPEGLADRLIAGFELVEKRASGHGITIQVDELAGRSLIAPSCGLGPATVEIAERALEILEELKDVLSGKDFLQHG